MGEREMRKAADCGTRCGAGGRATTLIGARKQHEEEK